MAGEEYTLTKIIRNGDEYILPGSTQRVSKKIFGTGEDGDCTIEYDDSIRGNVFLEAKEYNFNNFTICPNVKLRFCGNGVPIIRVKECFLNCGTILLRNPLLNLSAQYAEPYSKRVLCSYCNSDYSTVKSLYDQLSIECLKSYHAPGNIGSHSSSNNSFGASGGAGGSFYENPTIVTCICHGCVATSAQGGANSECAGGGGGGGGSWLCPTSIEECRQYINGCNGCSAVYGYGGNGGNASSWGGAGGGGFGLDGGGNGGTGGCGSGAVGGNSIYGTGGQGGCAYGGGGKGGCSYYGNGGYGGTSGGGGGGGTGGCSVFGKGGTGGNNTYCRQYCGKGGNSVFGDGGDGNTSCCNDGCGMTGYRAWGGIYDIGIYAKNLTNNGTIHGCGQKGRCYGGTKGATMHFVYSSFSSVGSITCTGNGCPDGQIIQCQI